VLVEPRGRDEGTGERSTGHRLRKVGPEFWPRKGAMG
jgi:hypothetical protein